jgi:acetyl esterase
VIEALKLGFMRLMFNLIVGIKWRRRTATDLSTRDEHVEVDDGSFPVRVYTPQGQGPFPAIVFYHGGGWVGGNIGTHDPLCRDLCSKTQHLIVSVDYRLAPEYPFPVAATDSLAALRWVRYNAAALNVDLTRLLVCGDSAGGNLAAVVAIQARDLYPRLIKGQVLIYPVTDHYSSAWPSYAEHGSSQHALPAKVMRSLWDLYLRNSPLLKEAEIEHDLATPYRVADLSGLPPAFVLTAECDVLRDEGLAYAERLAAAGVDMQHQRYAGQQHGFVGVAGPTEAHRKVMADIGSWLKLKNL